MSELLINGKDAYSTWGVRMGKGFIDTLQASSPLKPFIENKSRLEHGKRVITSNPRIDEREITLSFTISGIDKEDYERKKKSFYSEFYKGTITISIPHLGTEVYHLIYLGKSVSYGRSLNGRRGKISCRFCEPNPNARS